MIVDTITGRVGPSVAFVAHAKSQLASLAQCAGANVTTVGKASVYDGMVVAQAHSTFVTHNVIVALVLIQTWSANVACVSQTTQQACVFVVAIAVPVQNVTAINGETNHLTNFKKQ
jgi:hypothetical protein